MKKAIAHIDKDYSLHFPDKVWQPLESGTLVFISDEGISIRMKRLLRIVLKVIFFTFTGALFFQFLIWLDDD